jgi:general secretion pathway protein J
MLCRTNKESEEFTPAPEDMLGFTIAEILIAIAILSIIVTTIYGAYTSATRVIDNSRKTAKTYQMARFLLDSISEEIACAYHSYENERIVFVGVDKKDSLKDADTLTFTTTSSRKTSLPGQDRGMRQLKYKLDTEKNLFLRSEISMADIKQDEIPSEDEESYDIFSDNVAGLNFEYFDWEDWKNEYDTRQPETPFLPRAVRITISILDENKEQKTFTTAVFLQMSR